MELAVAVDASFDELVFADLLGTLARFNNEEIPVAPEQAAPVREFAAEWQLGCAPDRTAG